MANVAKRGAWFDFANGFIEALLGDLNQALGEDRGLADKEHLGGVAKVTLVDDRDIDIERIAVFERFSIRRDAVAHHVVDAGAHRFWERRAGAVGVIERGWNTVDVVNDVLMTQPVELTGGDPGSYVLPDHIQHTGSKLACYAHFGDFIWA